MDTHRVVEIADITIKKDVAESNLRSFAKLCILNGYFPDWYFSFSLSIGFLSFFLVIGPVLTHNCQAQLLVIR